MNEPSNPTGTFDAPLLDGVTAGTLRLQRCASCGHIPNYPRIACPRCFQPLEWFNASGTGTIQTHSILQRTHSHHYNEHLPIVLTRIKLQEGAEMISTLIGANRLDVKIGARAHFAGAHGWSTLPQFSLNSDVELLIRDHRAKHRHSR